jgi:hypothetical protein
MLAAIRRSEVDGVPFGTYNLHPFSWGRHARDPGYRKILDVLMQGRVGCLCKVRAVDTAVNPSIETHEEVSGGVKLTTTKWSTPRGLLTQAVRQPADQPPWCVKPFVQSREDAERWLSARNVPAVWDISKLSEQVAEIGSRGIAYLDYDDPFYGIALLFGEEDFALRIALETDLLESMIERRFELAFENLESLLRETSKLDMPLLYYTAGPETATPPLVSPAIFERLVVPFQKRLVERIHGYGYPVSLHCHGRVREVLPFVMECGFDALEPLEPPPQGNIELAELLRRTEGKLALMGYIQDQDFYLKKQQEIREHVRRIRELVGTGTGYVGTPTCTPFQFPPGDRYVDNYMAFLEEASRG